MEIAVILAVIGIFSAFATLSFLGMDETRDANAVSSVQSDLQSIISQAAARLDTPITSFNPSQPGTGANVQNVINAVSSRLSNNLVLTSAGGAYRLTITNSNRSASFIVGANGDVLVQNNPTGFQRFRVRVVENNAGYLTNQ